MLQLVTVATQITGYITHNYTHAAYCTMYDSHAVVKTGQLQKTLVEVISLTYKIIEQIYSNRTVAKTNQVASYVLKISTIK